MFDVRYIPDDISAAQATVAIPPNIDRVGDLPVHDLGIPLILRFICVRGRSQAAFLLDNNQGEFSSTTALGLWGGPGFLRRSGPDK
jgi:hypothetical protein